MVLLAMLATAIATSVAWFFVWRNNKKKFMQIMINIEGLINRNDTREELEAKLDKVFAELRASFIARQKID